MFPELTDYIILFLLGSLGAFVAGFLGVGGGIIYIPILDHFLSRMGFSEDILVKAILANSLFTIIFSGSVASYKQYRLGNFFPKEILYTAVPGMLTALVMTHLIRSGTWYSKEAFNYVFVIMLLVIIMRMFLARNKTVIYDEKEVTRPQFVATGFFTGFVTALSGLGGGVVMTPVFTDILKIRIKKASSISNGVIPLLAVAIGIYNLQAPAPPAAIPGQIGYIVLPVVLPMILATFVFAPIGVSVSQSSSPRTIRIVFASFVSIVCIKLLVEILK
jgi:uncharacterized membrane protein YfcA